MSKRTKDRLRESNSRNLVFGLFDMSYFSCRMGISSAGGLILGRAVQSYPAIATYQPVINGVAGELHLPNRTLYC